MPENELVLVRHGETEWSSSGRHTSFSEVPLTPNGRAEAGRIASRLAHSQFALVLTSPRVRAQETCALAGFAVVAETCDDLHEWNYGEYEGLTIAQIRQQVPHWTIFTGDPPGGETAVEVGARADQVIARVCAVDGSVVVFSHGHFLRVLAVRWIGLPVRDGGRLGLDTATVSVLGYEHDQRVVRVWNS